MNTSEELIIRADPRLRRTALLLVLGATAAGGLIVGWFLPWLLSALAEGTAAGRISTRLVCLGFLAFMMVIGGSVILFGVHTVRDARLVLAAGRYPLPGMRVIRDTRVLTGRPARVLGRGREVLGILLIVLALVLLGICVYAAAFLLLR
jgi:hypothetical protein